MPLLPNIARLIEEGGHIMVGRVPPIDSAAIAYDGRKSLAMLRQQPQETVPQLLARLDHAIALAWTEHRFTDEINTAPTTSRRR